MEKEYNDIFVHYINNIKDYADNCLKHHVITKDEHFKIHEPLLGLSNYLLTLLPKEPKTVD